MVRRRRGPGSCVRHHAQNPPSLRRRRCVAVMESKKPDHHWCFPHAQFHLALPPRRQKVISRSVSAVNWNLVKHAQLVWFMPHIVVAKLEIPQCSKSGCMTADCMSGLTLSVIRRAVGWRQQYWWRNRNRYNLSRHMQIPHTAPKGRGAESSRGAVQE